MIENNDTYLATKFDHFSKWKKERKISLIFSLIILSITISLIAHSMIENRSEFVLDKYYFISFTNYFQNFSAFFYLTYQSNLIYGITLFTFVLNATQRKFQVLFVFTVILTIVLVVFWTVLAWNISMSWTVLARTSTVHFFHPIFAIFVLFWYRKQFSVSKLGLGTGVIYSICYYIFCVLLYFFTLRQWVAPEIKTVGNQEIKNMVFFYTGLTIYPFMNFLHPFFYSGSNQPTLILLNLLMAFSVVFFPYWISLFYINIFGIKATNWRLFREIKSISNRLKTFFWVPKAKK